MISSKLNYRSIEARVSRTDRPQRTNWWQDVKRGLAQGMDWINSTRMEPPLLASTSRLRCHEYA
jgi:hypothetical protein